MLCILFLSFGRTESALTTRCRLGPVIASRVIATDLLSHIFSPTVQILYPALSWPQFAAVVLVGLHRQNQNPSDWLPPHKGGVDSLCPVQPPQRKVQTCVLSKKFLLRSRRMRVATKRLQHQDTITPHAANWKYLSNAKRAAVGSTKLPAKSGRECHAILAYQGEARSTGSVLARVMKTLIDGKN